MLRDYVDSDKLGVGIAIGMADERHTRVLACGKLDNGTGRDVDGDSVLEIGSVTKVFTALLLQDMVDRGEMRLNDPVQQYLPESVKMPAYGGKQITLLHLATHTSGLPAAADNGSMPTWRNPDPQDVYSADQLYAFLTNHRLRRAPGLQEEYSNLGMQLLGHVIALKAGKDYESLVLERICRPLGMESTRVYLTPELKERLAVGHSMPGARTHARAFHTVESGGKLMLAWGSRDESFVHVGGTYGYLAVISFTPKTRQAIFILSSCRGGEFVLDLMDPLWEGKPPKGASAIPFDQAVYDSHVGQYQLKDVATCNVRREGERLLLQWIERKGKRHASFEVFPQSPSVFRNEFWGIQAEFIQSHGGDPSRLKFISVGPYSGFKEPMTLNMSSRIPLPQPQLIHPGDIDFGRYEGRYRKSLLFGLFHVGPTLQIFNEADELGSHLVARAIGVPGYSEGEFIPVTQTSFVVNRMNTADDIRLDFSRERRGKTTRVEVYWNGKKLRGSRISDHPN